MIAFPLDPLTIQTLASNLIYRDRVECWLHREWGIDAISLQASQDCPGPIIACIDQEPVGVLAYKRYRADFQTNAELWINAVYVHRDFRRLGIGRKLVIAGCSRRYTDSVQQVFAYTDVPALYRSCGWSHVATDTRSGMQTYAFTLPDCQEDG